MRDDLNLLWLDLETTGTNHKLDEILEVGVIVTDQKLDEKLHGTSWVVKPDSWHGMVDDVMNMYLGNGLLIDCYMTTLTISDVDDEVVEYIKPALRKGKIILAGSGVGHFDRRFIDQWMPKLSQRLEYSLFDIGQVRRFFELAEVLKRLDHDPNKHRALSDAEDALSQAREFRALVQ